MSGNSIIIYCKCIHRNFVSAEAGDAILKGLEQCNGDIVIADDLCGLAGSRDPLLKTWAEYDNIFIIACYDRAVRWLFDMAGAPLSGDNNAQILNPRIMSPDEIRHNIRSVGSDRSDRFVNKTAFTGNQEPWFPVIDRDRCRSCKLCFNFCLFGVYTVEDNKVIVSHPENCKNNCPACARVCPEQAVIFPKLDQPPINGTDVDKSPKAALLRLDQLQKTDIYSLLRSRGKQGQRFSPEPRPRGNMLEMLHKQLDIPMDVLQALSPSDLNRIKQKASRAGDTDET